MAVCLLATAQHNSGCSSVVPLFKRIGSNPYTQVSNAAAIVVPQVVLSPTELRNFVNKGDKTTCYSNQFQN